MSALPRSACSIKTVLVVDDYVPLCSLVARYLSSIGFRVLTASDPIEAQRIVRSETWLEIDLLLTDLEMPRMRGEELARWLSHERPETRVLFMSAERQSLRDVDAVVIEKPFSLATLSAAVREALAPEAQDLPVLSSAA